MAHSPGVKPAGRLAGRLAAWARWPRSLQHPLGNAAFPVAERSGYSVLATVGLAARLQAVHFPLLPFRRAQLARSWAAIVPGQLAFLGGYHAFRLPH